MKQFTTPMGCATMVARSLVGVELRPNIFTGFSIAAGVRRRAPISLCTMLPTTMVSAQMTPQHRSCFHHHHLPSRLRKTVLLLAQTVMVGRVLVEWLMTMKQFTTPTGCATMVARSLVGVELRPNIFTGFSIAAGVHRQAQISLCTMLPTTMVSAQMTQQHRSHMPQQQSLFEQSLLACFLGC